MSEVERHAKRAAIAEARILIQQDRRHAQGYADGLAEAVSLLGEMLDDLEKDDNE